MMEIRWLALYDSSNGGLDDLSLHQYLLVSGTLPPCKAALRTEVRLVCRVHSILPL